MIKVSNIYYEKLLIPFQELIQDLDDKDTNSGDEHSELLGDFSAIIEFEGKISEAHENNQLFNDFQEIESFINNTWAVKYSDYKATIRNNLNIIIKLNHAISSYYTDDVTFFDHEIETNGLKVKTFDNVNQENFHFFDTVDTMNSLLILNFVDLTTVKNYMDNINEEEKILLIYFLNDIPITENLLGKVAYLAEESNLEDIEKLSAFVTLRKIIKGDSIHPEFNHTIIRNLPTHLKGKLSYDYKQFQEIFFILSEYNDHKSVLDKYLKLYQVIENFMFRKPIVDLTKKSVSKMISIRDFKSLYNKIDKSEHEVLSRFIKEVLSRQYDSSKTFKRFILERWQNCQASETDINHLFSEMEFTNKNGYYNFRNFSTQIDQSFPKLIYQIRNHIVHNKETEFHLHYGNFSKGVEVIIVDFLLVVLENIVFNLIIEDNSLVWYPHKELKLYS